MSNRLQVLIPEQLDAELRKAASRRRISKGEWVRRAIDRALEEERSAGDPLAALAALEGPTGDVDQLLAEIEAGRG
jgi:metal-responsive CopG/Arc/MetJ family transcriptional regulator